jgi:protein O-GlcNAc transferase
MGFLEKIKAGLQQKARAAAVASQDDAELAENLIAAGNRLEDQGDYPAALQLYDQAIAAAPRSARAHINKGIALHASGHLDQAISAYLRALAVEPDNAKAQFNMGNAWQAKGQVEFALGAYDKVLALEPGFVDAWVAHGNVLSDLGRHERAVASYRRALEIRPNYVEVRRNLALVLTDLGRLGEAAAYYEATLTEQPDALFDCCELSSIHRMRGDIDAAVQAARRACTIDPRSVSAHSMLLFCLSHQPAVTSAELRHAHLDFGRKFDAPPEQRMRLLNDKDRQRPLKIGIVSADLRKHSVASFFEPVYEHLANMPDLRIHIYATSELEDAVTQRFKQLCRGWTAVGAMSDAEFADLIVRDAIDVLIDLSGHTPGHRLTAFARKPAPLQMSWIGYPATTGMTTMDYYLGDRHFLPHGEFDDLFSEKIIRLPATAPFGMAENLPDINVLPAARNGYITFGSFNRLDKINRNVVALWSRVMHAVPDAKLLMGGLPAGGELDELLGWFGSCGIDTARLELHPRSDLLHYLNLHHAVDVCLDTFPYGGSTTSCHALTMGVPTLTLAGATPIASAGRSILSQVGIAELFSADNEDDFVAKGVWCAQHTSELAALRAGLRQRLLESSLMRPGAIAVAFAAATRHAWQRWCDGLPPESFETIEREGRFEIAAG